MPLLLLSGISHTEIERELTNGAFFARTSDGLHVKSLSFSDGIRRPYLYSASITLRLTPEDGEERDDECAIIFLGEDSEVVLASYPVS